MRVKPLPVSDLRSRSWRARARLCVCSIINQAECAALIDVCVRAADSDEPISSVRRHNALEASRCARVSNSKRTRRAQPNDGPPLTCVCVNVRARARARVNMRASAAHLAPARWLAGQRFIDSRATAAAAAAANVSHQLIICARAPHSVVVAAAVVAL